MKSARDTRSENRAGIPGARRVYHTKYTIYKIYNIQVRVNVDIVSPCGLYCEVIPGRQKK